MQKILYIGNLLSYIGYSPTTIELLGPRLESIGFSLSYAGKKKSNFSRFFEMLFALFFNKYDKVLIDTYSTRAFYFALMSALVAQFRNIPYYPILHGGDLPKRLRNKRIADIIFGHARINIAVSGYLESAFSKKGYSVILINNFLDIAKYSFKKRSFDIGIPAILWVRSFDVIYNPILALDILEKLHLHFPLAHLCMVGPDKDGSMIQFKEEVLKRNLDDFVLVLGRLNKDEWHKLSNNYNIFLNTTHIDNAPVSVTEAMALGIPVISTNVGGIPWLVEDGVTGLLYPDGDANSATRAIIRLIKVSNLAENLSIRARQQVELFDWDIVKIKWSNILG